MKKLALMVLLCAVALLSCGCGATKKLKYTTAISQLDSGKYDKAKKNFQELGDYQNAKIYADECDYKHAIACMDEAKYGEAATLLEGISGYSAAADMYIDCRYKYAAQLVEAGEYEEAEEIYEEQITYADSATLLTECRYLYAQALAVQNHHKKAMELLGELDDYKDSRSLYRHSAYILAKKYFKEKDNYEAYLLFDGLGKYKKSKQYIKKIMARSKSAIYKKAVETYEAGEMKKAAELFKGTKGYKDSDDYTKQIKLYRYAQGGWYCQTKAMQNIGSRYNLEINGWDIQVTIRQGYTTNNKESTYAYKMSMEKYKGKWCLHYGEDTYFVQSKKKLAAYRGGKKCEVYKRQQD